MSVMCGAWSTAARIFSQDGGEVKGIPPPLILVLGYSTGYSVWTVRVSLLFLAILCKVL